MQYAADHLRRFRGSQHTYSIIFTGHADIKHSFYVAFYGWKKKSALSRFSWLSRKSGKLPSSFKIRYAGLSPASLARSTAASVCPARWRTPPDLALREDMAWLNEIGCGWFGVTENLDRFCTILSANASADTLGIYGYSKSVPFDSRLSEDAGVNTAASCYAHRHANQATSVKNHLVDAFGRRFLSC